MRNDLTIGDLRAFLAAHTHVPDRTILIIHTTLAELTGDAYYPCKKGITFEPDWSGGVHITLAEEFISG